jgi:NADH-quinone oxidoreductase subunit M
MTMSSIGLPALNGFIGELLILQGVFVASKVWAAFAASGVVLGAAYMLYLYQRTMFGKVENPKNEGLLDLNHREFATFAPLLVLAFWMGLYPAPFLRRIETSVQRIVSRVNPQYAQAYAAAADCGGGPVTPAPAAAATASTTPAAGGVVAANAVAAAEPASTSAFLVATPCGPDGKPLVATPSQAVPR